MLISPTIIRSHDLIIVCNHIYVQIRNLLNKDYPLRCLICDRFSLKRYFPLEKDSKLWEYLSHFSGKVGFENSCESSARI